MRKKNGYWTYETCMEESRKYTTRSEFAKRSNVAYKLSCKNGWLDEYTWLKDGIKIAAKNRTKWTYETCMEESHKYTSRSEFSKGNGSAYVVALKNGWLDEYTWLKDGRFDIIRDKIDSVYVYEFKELNCAYVGRTLMRCQKDRDKAHIFNTDNDAVAKFAKEHNISVPKPIYLEENLTIEDGARQEEFWHNKYKENGWAMLNRSKTGSIGGLGKGKWTYETCMEESRKYTIRSEFQKGNRSAYLVAWKNGWLDEYTWLELQCKPCGYWTYETCMEESRKYTTRSGFQKGSGGAYVVARKNGWLDEYTWLELQCKPNGYWTYETCMEESRNYTTRNEFKKGGKGAYVVARKNGWLDEFTWLELQCKPCGYWTYETCMEESRNYTTRNEFKKGGKGAYRVALKNGWLNDFFPK